MSKALKKIPKIQDVDLEVIYEFIDNGDPSNAPAEIVAYLDLMDKIRGMHLRIDRYGSKDHIVKHLIKVEGLSYFLANKAYNQTLEYFYADNEVSKEAWRNIIAGKMEKNISLAQMIVKDVSDAAKVNKMLKELAEVLGLDQPDDEKIPDGMYDKPVKIYTISMEDLGKKPQGKKELRDFIQSLPEVPERVKEILEQEAMLKPINFLPEANEDPRKS